MDRIPSDKKLLEVKLEAEDKIEEEIIERYLLLQRMLEVARERLNQELKEELFFVERGAKIGEDRQSALNKLNEFIEKIKNLFPDELEKVK